MDRGDHIYVRRLGYTHHGIDVGDGQVVHYTGEVGQKSDASVCRTSLGDFSRGAETKTRVYGECDSIDETIKRAESRLNEDSYNLVFNNCEHFATWCKTGEHKSEQVKDTTTTTGASVLAGSAVAGGIGVVSAGGAAAGLSGAGVMSGLATVGGVVGGGAVAGIAIVGAAPAEAETSVAAPG